MCWQYELDESAVEYSHDDRLDRSSYSRLAARVVGS
jgi:hypothetical protein